MSRTAAVPEWVILDPTLHHIDVRVYAYLVMHVPGGVTDTDVEMIGVKLEVSDSTVADALDRLVDAGALVLDIEDGADSVEFPQTKPLGITP